MTYRVFSGDQVGRRSVQATDILRAAVVLLHATFEDFLRSLARECLPRAEPRIMDTIPLKRLGGQKPSEKFALGALLEHRGKSVEDVIEESIDSFLERSNYNNAGELVRLLENLRLEVEPIRRFLPQLERMMARRHQIVHRADCTEESGRGRHPAQSLRRVTVEKWIEAVRQFQSTVLGLLQRRNTESA